MKSRLFLQWVLVGVLIGISSYAGAEELVENLSIKSIQEEPEPVAEAEEDEIRTSKVLKRQIPLGHAIVLSFPRPFARASMANPEVADSLVISPKQIYVTGKSLGYTTLTLWGKGKSLVAVLELVVHVPIAELQQTLLTLFSAEKGIVVTAAHEHIVLTGQVSSADMKDKIGQVARAYASGKVLNFLKYLKE